MSKDYRKNVGVVVFNKNKKVLLCSRNDKENAWQFPQGGIDNNDTSIESAAKREVFEETSITSTKTIHITDKCYYYDYPPHIAHKYQHKGQCQYWVLLYFYGSDSEINLSTSEPEFKDYKWADIKTATQEIVEFKKEIYNQITNIFEPIINEFSD